MPTKLGGKPIAAYDATSDPAFELQGGFVATRAYRVSDEVEGGNLIPVYIVQASELVENGGRFKLEGGTPITINTSVTNRKVIRGKAIPVYLMGDE